MRDRSYYYHSRLNLASVEAMTLCEVYMLTAARLLVTPTKT